MGCRADVMRARHITAARPYDATNSVPRRSIPCEGDVLGPL